MIINADFHVHSKFSMATSKNMTPEVIAPQAKLKGLDLVGTGDVLHHKWLNILNDTLEETQDGIYSLKNRSSEEYGNSCDFILTVEVEDIKRVHHLIIVPSFEAAEGLREELRGNLDSDGRPKIHMSGAEIMDKAHEHECVFGPSHAFTPWTSIYKEYDSIYDCYSKKPDFVELGLSADSDMADQIKELTDIPFLSNSDAHSPWPHRLGREFNEILIKELTFKEVAESIIKNRIQANYGFDPRLGKYHKTACIKCYKVFGIEEALKNKMKCPCSGIIKKGVDYRIYELSTWNKPHHPPYRPKYIHILPLAEIISLLYDKGITTVFVQKIWKNLVQKFGDEISVLIKADLDELNGIDSKLAEVIEAFRKNNLKIRPGGGGRYGKIIMDPDTFENNNEKSVKTSDNTLDNYY